MKLLQIVLQANFKVNFKITSIATSRSLQTNFNNFMKKQAVCLSFNSINYGLPEIKQLGVGGELSVRDMACYKHGAAVGAA